MKVDTIQKRQEGGAAYMKNSGLLKRETKSTKGGTDMKIKYLGMKRVLCLVIALFMLMPAMPNNVFADEPKGQLNINLKELIDKINDIGTDYSVELIHMGSGTSYNITGTDAVLNDAPYGEYELYVTIGGREYEIEAQLKQQNNVIPINESIFTFTVDLSAATVQIKSVNLTVVPVQYSIKTEVIGGTITGDKTVNEGEDVTISYSPKTGYHLSSITVDGASVSTTTYADSYTFTNVTAGHTIAVVYSIDQEEENGGDDEEIIDDPKTPLAELEKLDHFAYIIGYPEGVVSPLRNVTREEVAMIFYRLLTDESRNALLSDTNSFTDLGNHEWSNRAISTLFNAEVINGYPDGTFKPSAPITRAEFATIAAKFDKLELSNTSKFTDIAGHWAERFINSSEVKGWIKGYEDNTFKPDQDITRAEAITLINKVLGREVKKENIHTDAMLWSDNPETEWYYDEMMEATNSHDYVNEDDGDELWTGIKANKVWP
jgi:hypothetical protein